MSTQYVYVMKGLNKVVGGNRFILKDMWLSFLPGAKIGVLGHNGAGKSTLLRIMAGVDKDYTGEAWAANNVKVGYLAQEPELDLSKNVFDNITEGLKEKKQLLDKFNEISAKFMEEMSPEEMDELINLQGELQEKIDACNAWDMDREIQMAMDALGCPLPNADVSKISGGEKRRVALCRLLLEKPDMLLLDEPTNHLDAYSIAWLERFLREYPGTVVMVTHDRYFLDNVTGWILELDRGEGIPYEGNYTLWLEQKEKRLGQEEKQESERRKQLKRELEWVRQSPKARQAKSKARLKAFEELMDKERESRTDISQIIIPDGPKLGQVVIEASNISKSFNERKLIDNLSFNIPPRAIIGIIGPNGMGKTTLFKIITGTDKPDNGNIKIGESVILGYVDQSRDILDPNKTVWQEISDGLEDVTLGKLTIKTRAYCSAFNFKGQDQQKLMNQLSGGERNRVHLAKMLKKGANVILLDEPTNDLDVDTLRALEEAISDFAGTAIIISHDRWFLDRIATHILAYEGNGHVEWFEGNYADYVEDRKRRTGENIEEVQIKYRRIS